jgi:hypothetical protein
MKINDNEKFVTIPASKFEKMEKICNNYQELHKNLTLDIQLCVTQGYISNGWRYNEPFYYFKQFKYTDDEYINTKFLDELNFITKSINIESTRNVRSSVNDFKQKYQNLSLFDRIFNWKKI